MAGSTASTTPTPPRTDAIPESYAIHVSDQRILVWQYAVSLSEPDGEWTHVETLDREDGPRLSLEYATLTGPGENGYWVYSKSYDCALDCA